MTVTLLVRGGEIELHESEKFNKVRHRLNRARKMSEDYRNGAIDGKTEGQRFEPFHLLTFKTYNEDDDNGGRVCVDIENAIGAVSDEPRDGAVNDDEEDDDE